MKEYGFYIASAYGVVFLGLLYLTKRYWHLNKHYEKNTKEY